MIRRIGICISIFFATGYNANADFRQLGGEWWGTGSHVQHGVLCGINGTVVMAKNAEDCAKVDGVVTHHVVTKAVKKSSNTTAEKSD